MSLSGPLASQRGMGLQGSVTCPRSHFSLRFCPQSQWSLPPAATRSALKADMRGREVWVGCISCLESQLLVGGGEGKRRGEGERSEGEKEGGCANTAGVTARVGLDLDTSPQPPAGVTGLQGTLLA